METKLEFRITFSFLAEISSSIASLFFGFNLENAELRYESVTRFSSARSTADSMAESPPEERGFADRQDGRQVLRAGTVESLR